MSNNFSERIYRDPIHNMIRLRTDTEEGRLLSSLIDTPEFQRLRRIKQLGLALFTYQGAEHSRFTHSLGVMHLACRIIEKLSLKYETARENSVVAKCAALLHDVGHGAFSHVFEKILGFKHEDYTIQAIKSNDTAIGKALRSFSSELPEKVCAVIRGDFERKWVSQLISSHLDVDRMDYLLRDAYMTGVKYGIYDLDWLIESIEIDLENDRIYVSSKGFHAVEDYLQARHYMFKQVYFHRNLRAAEVVLSSLIERAVDLVGEGKDVWFAEDTPFEKILKRKELTLDEHFQMDDSDVIFHIKKWQFAEDPILADLSRRFVNRQFFKAFDLDMDEKKKTDFLERSREEVERAGFDSKYYFIKDIAKDEPYIKNQSKKEKAIFVEVGYSNPEIKEISQISSAIRGLQGYQIHRICFPQEVKDAISKIYKNGEGAFSN
ncbi:MAG: HD domain-containing protein [Pyrinomonadaceae bacterium]|nr:HD domain-containing protein [Pyrinomonadaceae bacterium]MCX7638981.1 HD domain-containing protein [Pyrinomonadaceae bacterium]MDW8303800.1 HD domain-containing protein [Acidobacteriota bacterium]